MTYIVYLSSTSLISYRSVHVEFPPMIQDCNPHMNQVCLPPTGGGGVQQPSHSGQGGHGAAASHVGTVALHPELSSGRGSHKVYLLHL